MGQVTLKMIKELAKQLRGDEIAQMDSYYYQIQELDEVYAKMQELIANRNNGIPHDKKYVELDTKKLKKSVVKQNENELKRIQKITGDFSQNY